MKNRLFNYYSPHFPIFLSVKISLWILRIFEENKKWAKSNRIGSISRSQLVRLPTNRFSFLLLWTNDCQIWSVHFNNSNLFFFHWSTILWRECKTFSANFLETPCISGMYATDIENIYNKTSWMNINIL